MQNLLYKEFTLSIHKFFLVLPFLTGALFLIPQWPFFIALMYFFFISVPNILSSYNTLNDYAFTIMMPVRKSDIVKSKITAFMLLELMHLITGALYAYLNTVLYKSGNFMLDPNTAFFGIAFSMFGLFNIILFPMYFKTAYHFGLPVIISCTVAAVYIFSIEMLVLFNEKTAFLLEGGSMESNRFQYAVLAAGIIIFLVFSYLSMRISIKRFEKISL